MKKEKKAKKMTLKEKCENMFNTLHISKDVGEGAMRQILQHTARSKFPMPALAEKGLKFFANKAKDEHGSLLLAIFCMVYSRILLDPNIGCVTMSEKKGGNGNEQGNIKEANK